MSCQSGRVWFQADLGSHPPKQSPGERHSGQDSQHLQSLLPCDHESLHSALVCSQDRAIPCLTDGDTKVQGWEEAGFLHHLSLFSLESWMGKWRGKARLWCWTQLLTELWPIRVWAFLPEKLRWGSTGGSEIRGQTRPGKLKVRF